MDRKRTHRLGYALLLLSTAAAVSASCSGKSANDNKGAGQGTAASAGTGVMGSAGTSSWLADAGAGMSVHSGYPCPGCDTFPGLGGSECSANVLAAPTLAYPPDGVLLPPNMNVLEVQFIPNSDATLFEVDFSSASTQVTVETQCVAVPDVRGGPSKGCGLTLSQAAWNDIANNNREAEPVKVTVRATKSGLACASTSANSSRIAFAKEDLAGGIYYWQSATFGGIGGKTGGIYSHDFGSFDPTPTPFYTSDATGTCIGCHTVSRDGARMALEYDDPDADDEMGDVHSQLMDIATRSALGGKNISPGFQTFTHDHLKLIASTFKAPKAMPMPGMGMPGMGMGMATPDLEWAVFDETGTQLASTAVGNDLAATQPDLSADDATMVYVVPQAGTISTAGDHHFMSGALYTSSFDYANNAFGAPSPFLAPQGAQTFYYPSFAPDKSFVIMNSATGGDSFYNRLARVALVHYPAGGAAVDLPALNTPPTGTADTSKLSNSWPKWSPFVQKYRGHNLLWVTFSSNRDYGLHLTNQGFDNCYPPESPDYDQPQPLSKQGVTYEACAQPQIWMAAVIVDEDGSIDGLDRSFPAFWLPFQDVNSHNHTAQWVEKVVSTPPPPADDAGTPDGGYVCTPAGGSCTNSICCSDSVCCGSGCAASCVK
ncbi:MAG TPA: hypothetical protein VGI10_18560 [Polyangiaceae bacterium]|jgi:hypothetical protein